MSNNYSMQMSNEYVLHHLIASMERPSETLKFTREDDNSFERELAERTLDGLWKARALEYGRCYEVRIKRRPWPRVEVVQVKHSWDGNDSDVYVIGASEWLDLEKFM